MSRRRQSTAEDIIDIAALLPWWIGLLIAAIIYLALHAVALNYQPAAPTSTAELSSNIVGQIILLGARIGQYLLPALFALGALLSAVKAFRRRQIFEATTDRSSASRLNELSWQDFESLISEYFRRKGYRATETPTGPDGGVDIALKKDNELFLVQCKHWRAQKVGVSIVRELYGVMASRGAGGGWVVTTGAFTREAREFASGRNIELLNGKQFDRLLGSKQERPRAAPAAAQPACRRCGSSMVRRTARKGPNAGNDFWGCSAFPACRETRPIARSAN